MSKWKALFQCFVWCLFTIGAWAVTSWSQSNPICVGAALVPTTIALVYGIAAYRGFSGDVRRASAALDVRYIESGPGDYGEFGAAAPHTTPGSGWIGLPKPPESH